MQSDVIQTCSVCQENVLCQNTSLYCSAADSAGSSARVQMKRNFNTILNKTRRLINTFLHLSVLIFNSGNGAVDAPKNKAIVLNMQYVKEFKFKPTGLKKEVQTRIGLQKQRYITVSCCIIWDILKHFSLNYLMNNMAA